MHFPRVKLMCDAAALVARVNAEAASPGTPSHEDLLGDRTLAAEAIAMLLEQNRELRQRSAGHEMERRAAVDALPLLRYAEARGGTLKAMRAHAQTQRLAGEGDAMLAWVNRDDLLRMAENRQAEDHGDHRRVVEVQDDHPVFGHIITYDEDLNDPPAELRPDVEAWLKAEQPETIVASGKLSMSYVLNFPDATALAAFRAAWGREPGPDVLPLPDVPTKSHA